MVLNNVEVSKSLLQKQPHLSMRPRAIYALGTNVRKATVTPITSTLSYL